MPKLRVGEFRSHCVVDLEGRKRNLASVLVRGLPFCEQVTEHGVPLAIVASGPSVRQYREELRAWDGKVWAINGAYDYLLDEGVVPHGFFGIDPLPGLADYVRRPNRKTTFYIASSCDPSVFDALKGHEVWLWNPDGEESIHPPGTWIVGGGTTAATRAPYLALLLGFRDITLYGVDSSFEPDATYCYSWGRYDCDINEPRVLVEANGEGPFATELGLMKQVSQLGVVHQKFNGMLKIRCGGLMDAFMRAPTVSDEDLELMDAPDSPDASQTARHD